MKVVLTLATIVCCLITVAASSALAQETSGDLLLQQCIDEAETNPEAAQTFYENLGDIAATLGSAAVVRPPAGQDPATPAPAEKKSDWWSITSHNVGCSSAGTLCKGAYNDIKEIVTEICSAFNRLAVIGECQEPVIGGFFPVFQCTFTCEYKCLKL